MSHQSKKLFDSMSHLSDALIDEAQSTQTARKRHPRYRWLAAAACLCLIAGIAFAAFRGSGTPTLYAKDIWRGALSVGGNDTMDYSLRRLDAGEALLTSPVRDAQDAETLSVYRSLEPKNSNDVYRLLLTWADDMTRNVKEQLGIDLIRGEVTSSREPYDSRKPETNEYSMYSLEVTLSYQDAVLTLKCASDGSLTYYSLRDIEELYTALYPPLTLAQSADDRQLLSAAEEMSAFVSALTGRAYNAQASRLYRFENSPDRVSLSYTRADLPGTQLSREMMAPYGGLSVDLETADGQYRIRNISIFEEHYEYLGDYALISLAQAEEYVRKGCTFGGLYCAICRAQSDLPALDFSTYDGVQVEYLYQNLGYAVPHYAFYKQLPEDDGAAYGVVYVPAVEVRGLEEYLLQRAEDHQRLLHTAE